MRLTELEVDAIKAAAREAFGADVVVRLFGSRVRDDLRGGDIDLHFEVVPGRDTDRAVDLFEESVFRTMDEQRIDKIFTVRGRADLSPFEQIAYRDGVAL